jgi:hypothetical protein
LRILSSWLPYGTRGADLVSPSARLLILAGLLVAGAIWGWCGSARSARRLFLAAAVFGLFHLAFLAFTYLFSSIQPDLIPRIFSPLWPAGCLLLAATAQMLIEKLTSIQPTHPFISHLVLAGLALGVLVSLVYYTPRMAEMVNKGNTEGVGYTSRIYRVSPVFEQISKDLEGRALISDEPALILLYTGRGAYDWEEWIQGSLSGALQRPAPGQGTGRLDDLMRARAALVLFPFRVEEEYGLRSRELLVEWTSSLISLYHSEETEIYTLP